MLCQVARTSAGLINKEHRLRGRSSDASGGAMDEDGESAEEGEEEELGEDVLCVTVDGKGANTSRFVTLRMIYEATETEVSTCAAVLVPDLCVHFKRPMHFLLLCTRHMQLLKTLLHCKLNASCEPADAMECRSCS